jgi:hypothetical protein
MQATKVRCLTLLVRDGQGTFGNWATKLPKHHFLSVFQSIVRFTVPSATGIKKLSVADKSPESRQASMFMSNLYLSSRVKSIKHM